MESPPQARQDDRGHARALSAFSELERARKLSCRMAEAGRNSGGMSQPGRGSAYSTNFPSPMTYQPMQVPPFQAGYQDMFVQSYPRVMPISHFQGNVLCQDNSQFQGSGHYQGDNQFQNNSQFQANSQYPSYNHYQNNAHFQGNGHFEGNGHLQGNQYPGNLQYEGNFVIPSNPGTRMMCDENYQTYIVNNATQVAGMDLQSNTRQYNSVSHSLRRGPPPKSNVRYNSGKTDQNWSLPVGQSMLSSGSQTMAASGSSTVNVSKGIGKSAPVTSDGSVGNVVNANAPQNNSSFQNRTYSGNNKSGNTVGNFTKELPRNPNAIENEAFGGEAKVSPQGNDCEGIINGIASEGGVKNKGMNRGRGGKGRRGGRRNYGTDRLSQGPNMPYTWYEPRGAAYDQDQKKRDRESALAETAAFMQRMSLGRTDNPPTKELDNNDRRSRGGRGRYDWGGSHGGVDKRQQRSNSEEEKQGKEWKNRQVRTEDGRTYNGGYSNVYDQPNDQERPLRQEKNFGRGRNGRKNNNGEGQGFDGEVGEREESASTQGPKPGRGRGRGRNDNGRKLWGGSEQSERPGRESAPAPVKNEQKAEKESSPVATPSITSSGKEDEQTQRDRLMEQLMKGVYECMVCCDRIKQHHAIWSCVNCYNCFHLGCIKKWAKSSSGDSGWRCPACQAATPKVPNAYLCFCGKLREPEWNRRDTPHSCGEVCGRGRKIDWCNHKCNILCHPGPCPPCTAYVKKTCPCGAKSQDVRCSITEPFVCEGVCGKVLNCGGHTCEKLCHSGPCGDCQQEVMQKCYCGKESREVLCTEETCGISLFACEKKCSRKLDCGIHICIETCHEGECKPCARAISAITRCPCGKVPLEKLYERDGAIQRKSCSDPIPTCSQPCQRTLKCGVPGSYHECQALCHEGPCPPCPLETPVKCRCGAMDQNVLCSELTAKADEVTCKKPCKKMRQCSRHKCSTKCCIDVDHLCTLVCRRTLSCGLHKCQELCHRGNCPRCWQTSFEELTCHCGAAVLYPPVPCGTKPPPCERPCSRPQSCTHKATHNCHPDDTCPPCTILVDKPCFGNHKTMRSTPCYLKAVSCGAICGFPLPCGLHKCIRVCHEAPCVPSGTLCTQKCMKPRENCGHPCSNPCHSGPCPDNSCKEMVKITCTCGHRKTMLQCSENDREYRALATSLLASQMQNMNNGSTVDLTDIFTSTTRPDKLKRLHCNDECIQIERNRRLALALQIENPETRDKLGNASVLFSDFMKDEARKDPNLAKMVHDALTDLVLKAKESKQKSRSHSFAPMNREKRQFVHEYCEHFGCQSQSYDDEPKKNIVATAVKGMCFIPPISVLTLVQREQGQKKVPVPVWSRKATAEDSRQGMKKLEKSSSIEKETESATAKAPPIDYFDFED